MKKSHTTMKGRAVRVTANAEINGYVMRCADRADGAHVQFWHDRSTRCWFCAVYDANGYSVSESDNAYLRSSIEGLALRLVDLLVEGHYDSEMI